MTITAKIIADSINLDGERITTVELEYPRFIHSEFMTHRDFSRNAASSRAIPILKMIKLIWKNMAKPIHWGQKQSGMQASEQIVGVRKTLGKILWSATGYSVTVVALTMEKLGIHKQVANRILEPWSHIKVLVTSTKFKNWETLRLHPDAQPEIQELARQIKRKMELSTPLLLQWGQWHLPYISNSDENSLEIQKEISTSCAAQISYRNLDTSIEKSRKIFGMLINSDVFHASPFEHPAQAVQSGGTGNFTGTGWRQFRADIEDGTYKKN
jgi:hypothetical protein